MGEKRLIEHHSSPVRRAAAEVNAYSESIDVLINNAAIMASPYHTTMVGFEAQLGTDHIGTIRSHRHDLPKIPSSKTGS
ncbi:hypothetical protein BGW37DRAFT_520372 [Umbelopsis sp. PMI_123]|nr:hypothetical protein BGW37DRAFT_520372 [Umbelopsis sp. PMI_123]